MNPEGDELTILRTRLGEDSVIPIVVVVVVTVTIRESNAYCISRFCRSCPYINAL